VEENQKTDKNKKYENDEEAEIIELLNEMGIPHHVLGYRYLIEAIVEALKESNGIKTMTKNLYAKVAEKFNVTAQTVERAMRNAIEIAWVRGESDAIDYLMGYSSSFSKEKTTNSEFIALIVEKVRKELGKKE
jgi:two-component system response regulator (stage 0 sporulation protein A)